MFSKETYSSRRNILKKKMGKGLLLFPGNGESGMNYRDNWYPFRQDSTFLYYTGIDRPNLFFLIDIDENREILLGDDPTPEEVVWTGEVLSLKSSAEKAGISEVKPFNELSNYLKSRQKNSQSINYLPPYRGELKILLSNLLEVSVAELENSKSVELIKAIARQRSIKSEEELGEIEKAVNTTAKMHRHAIINSQPGKTEKEIAGELRAIAIAGGGDISFPIILTKNGQYLHNHPGNNKLENGDLIICDCGAETAMHYAGDMTRSFAVGRKLTNAQKEIYEIVLEAQEAAVASLKPGFKFIDSHLIACTKIAEGLKNLGLMKGDPEEAVSQGAHALFFQCGLGHMMGLDVHDMENFGEEYVGYSDEVKKSTQFGLKSLRLGKELEVGNVITVEPGIYFNPILMEDWRVKGKLKDFINYEAVLKYKNFGGIRVEEDFVITESGKKLLGDPLVKTIVEIESLC